MKQNTSFNRFQSMAVNRYDITIKQSRTKINIFYYRLNRSIILILASLKLFEHENHIYSITHKQLPQGLDSFDRESSLCLWINLVQNNLSNGLMRARIVNIGLHNSSIDETETWWIFGFFLFSSRIVFTTASLTPHVYWFWWPEHRNGAKNTC